MTTHTQVHIPLCRALAAALIAVAVGTAGTALAQISVEVLEVEDPNAARMAAEGELESARAAVAEARAAAIAAKDDLEAAVAASTSDEARHGDRSQSGPDTPETGQPADQSGGQPSWASTLAQAKSSEIEALNRLIGDLKVERRQLLTYMTTRHPLIVDADLRIEEYQQQLAALAGGPTPHRSVERPATVELVVPDEPPMTGPLNGGALGRQEAALQLDEALAKWETAQQTLEAAMDAESAAVQRWLATLASQRPVAEAAQPAAASEATPPAPLAVVHTADDSASRASQPLVLAALILALVVAAVASVKLARAADNTVFAGADDAAAALSLPVVGVIPATTHAVTRGAFFQRYRALTFVLQILLAITVFAAVAYVVQNPALRF